MHRFTTHHQRLLRCDDDTCYVHFYIILSWLTKSWNLFSRKKIISQMCWSLMKNFFSLFFTQRSENYESVYGKLKQQQLSVCVTFHSFSLLHFFTSSILRAHACVSCFIFSQIICFQKCFLFSLFVSINTFHPFFSFFIIITIFFTYN